MGEHNGVRFRIKTDKYPNDMWSFSIGLSHFTDETYLYVNLFRWSVSIGYLYEDQVQITLKKFILRGNKIWES